MMKRQCEPKTNSMLTSFLASKQVKDHEQTFKIDFGSFIDILRCNARFFVHLLDWTQKHQQHLKWHFSRQMSSSSLGKGLVPVNLPVHDTCYMETFVSQVLDYFGLKKLTKLDFARAHHDVKYKHSTNLKPQ